VLTKRREGGKLSHANAARDKRFKHAFTSKAFHLCKETPENNRKPAV
jgi:hypothetical protein